MQLCHADDARHDGLIYTILPTLQYVPRARHLTLMTHHHFIVGADMPPYTASISSALLSHAAAEEGTLAQKHGHHAAYAAMSLSGAGCCRQPSGGLFVLPLFRRL